MPRKLAMTLALVATAATACAKPPPAALLPPPAPVVVPAPAPPPASVPAAVPLPTPTTVVVAAPPPMDTTPAALGPPPLYLPEVYAPLFTAGNNWVFKVTELDGERQPTGTRPVDVTCTVAKVTAVAGGLASTLTCNNDARTDGMDIVGTYVATRAGLYRTQVELPDPALLVQSTSVLVPSPPRPQRIKANRNHTEEDGTYESNDGFAVRHVAGHGQVELVRLFSHSEDDSGPVDREEWFAPKVGLVYVMGLGGIPQQFQEFKLLTSTVVRAAAALPVAPIPPQFAGKPPLATVLPTLLGAGLKCAESLGNPLPLGAKSASELLGAPLQRLPANWDDDNSDVRPFLVVHTGKMPGAKCKLTIETYGGHVARIGSNFTAKPDELAASLTTLGPPAEHRELAKGSVLDVFHYADAVLVVYQPMVAKPDYEWWLYDPRTWAQEKAPDAGVWMAYSYNDFAAYAENPKLGVPQADVVDAYEQAVKLVPGYGRAWLRLAKFLEKTKLDPVRARQAAGEALKSKVSGVANQASVLLGKMP